MVLVSCAGRSGAHWTAAAAFGHTLAPAYAAGWTASAASSQRHRCRQPPRRSFESRAESWDACRDTVRTRDMDNMLCLAFLPKDVQGACLAIRAFNVEVGSAADKARDPKMALVRLGWWTQALDGIREKRPPSHPVAEALCSAVHHFSLDDTLLESLIEWRKRDLSSNQPETIDSLELYAEGTQSAMLNLTLQALGEFEHQGSVKAASHVGQAIGLTLLLRGTRFHASRNRCYLPKTITSANKLQLSSLIRGEPSQELSQCVFEIATEAKRHLELASALETTRLARTALLPAAIARTYLDRLDKCNYDVMNPELANPTPTRVSLQYQLLKNSLLGRF